MNNAEARAARYGSSCPVCDGHKEGGAPFCSACMQGLSQPQRNVACASDEEYRLAILKMRQTREAARLGLRIAEGRA